MTSKEFLNNLATGATWSAGVAFKRSNALPLDKYSIFESLAAATEYAQTNPVAYPGQVIVTLSTDGYDDSGDLKDSTVSAYIITAVGTDGSLQKLASTTGTGDVGADITSLKTEVSAIKGRLDTAEADIDDHETRIAALETALKALQDLVNAISVVAGNGVTVTKSNNTYTVAAKAAASKSTTNTNLVVVDSTGIHVDEETVKAAAVEAISLVSVETPASGYIAQYKLQSTLDGKVTDIGTTISIPKDKVVEKGEVVTADDNGNEGTFLKLTLANDPENPVYIDAKTFMDNVKCVADETTITESDDGTHTLSVKAGGITVRELADGAVTTAKIADGAVTAAKLAADAVTWDDLSGTVPVAKLPTIPNDNLADNSINGGKLIDKSVTKAKLAEAVQTSLGKADTAVQSVTTGSANGTVAVDGTDVKVKGINNAAYSDVESTLANDAKLPTGAAVTAAINSTKSNIETNYAAAIAAAIKAHEESLHSVYVWNDEATE